MTCEQDMIYTWVRSIALVTRRFRTKIINKYKCFWRSRPLIFNRGFKPTVILRWSEFGNTWSIFSKVIMWTSIIRSILINKHTEHAWRSRSFVFNRVLETRTCDLDHGRDVRPNCTQVFVLLISAYKTAANDTLYKSCIDAHSQLVPYF